MSVSHLYENLSRGKGILKLRKKKRREIPSKVESLHIHVKRAVKERYGFDLTGKMERDIVLMISNGKGKFLRKTSNSKTVWEVPVADSIKKKILDIKFDKMRVVYDKHRKQLVTALPLKENGK
jgi:hypothetical protein